MSNEDDPLEEFDGEENESEKSLNDDFDDNDEGYPDLYDDENDEEFDYNGNMDNEEDELEKNAELW